MAVGAANGFVLPWSGAIWLSAMVPINEPVSLYEVKLRKRASGYVPWMTTELQRLVSIGINQ